MTSAVPHPEIPFLSVPLTAQRLGVTYQHAYSLVLSGQLPAEMRNGRWAVDKRAVERLATERERVASEPTQ